MTSMAPLVLGVWVVLTLPYIVRGEVSSQLCELKTALNTTLYQACLPSPRSMTTVPELNVTVAPATATCGTPKEIYCTIAPVHCFECDASNATISHPALNMYDDEENTPTSWISSTRNKLTDMQINITFSFGKMYYLEGNIRIVLQSLPPARMTLMVSRDKGLTFEPFEYYYTDCSDLYSAGVPSTITKQSPWSVQCTQKYSSATKYTGGELLFDLQSRFRLFVANNVLNRQALFTVLDTDKMFNFLTFTDIRIMLQQPGTDGRDRFGATTDLRKYYYAISDLSAIAGCFCNLHGKFCVANALDQQVCVCQHNTEGPNCERCKPLYNNRPWKRGSYLPYPAGTANECQMCNCNNHAISCTYNPTISQGICNNCTHNTSGINCHTCAPTFYRNSSLALNHPLVCVDCNCEPLGVLSGNMNCVTAANSPGPNGQCSCKNLVIGYRCDRCIDQYYGLLQINNAPGICKSCQCNLDGTVGRSNVCAQLDGQCPCKPNIMGRVCDKCKDGFFSFPTAEPNRDCENCMCDRGGSVTLACNTVTGICQCRPNIIGNKCTKTLPNFYAPYIDVYTQQPTAVTVSSQTTCRITSDLQNSANPFTGLVFANCKPKQRLVFDLLTRVNRQPGLQWPYKMALRYSYNGTGNWSLEMQIGTVGSAQVDTAFYTAVNNNTAFDPNCPSAVNTLIRKDTVNLTPGVGLSWMNGGVFNIDARCQYSVFLDVLSGPIAGAGLTIDSVVIVPDPNSLRAFTQSDNTTVAGYQDCLKRMLDLTTRPQALISLVCQRMIFETGTQMSNGGLPCNCDSVGSVPGTMCNMYGGQCTCRPGVTGLRCDQCAPGFFNFTSAGCTPCNCNVLGSEIPVCNYTTGQCPCLPNVALMGQNNTLGLLNDLQCRACLPNFFGFSTGSGCQVCGCNMDGSNSTQCADNGQCPCKYTINGPKCDSCAAGNFKFSPTGCVTCNCTMAGSVNAECHQIDGGCLCKKNVMGDKCDQCRPGTFNLDTNNPDGCQPCYCYGHSTSCQSATGHVQNLITATQTDVASWPAVTGLSYYISAPAAFLGNKISSYAQALSVTYKAKTGNMPILLSRANVVFLIGNNGVTYFYPVPGNNVTASSSAPVTLNIVLHEQFWYITPTSQPTYFQFYALLSSIKEIRIQRIFSAVQADITGVSLVSSMPAPAGTDPSLYIGYVENCTCNGTRNVQGKSCESCAEGHHRKNVTGTNFDVCIPCECNNHNMTNPPLCDSDTGECLNCRNGTLGKNCETCAANIMVNSDCTICLDSFWGLTKDGCQPCNCDPNGSLGNLCNQSTGQCTCAPNVMGRTCNMCSDNFFNMKALVGCTECDGCYALVTAEMLILRSILANMTQLVTQLSANDRNAELGSFSTRLQTALKTMGTLIVFLNEATNVESAVSVETKRLNATLQSLNDKLNLDAPTTLIQANSSLQMSADRVNQSMVCIADATAFSQQAWVIMSGQLQDYLAQLKALVTNIQSILATFNSLSNNTLKSFFDQLKAVQTIVAKVTEVNNRTGAVLKQTQLSQVVHRNNTVRIAQLKNFVTATAALGKSIQTDAQFLSSNATLLRNQAGAMLISATALTLPTEDFATVTTRSTQLNGVCASLNNQANQAVNTSQNTRLQITNIQGAAAELSNRVSAAQARKMAVFSQINLTYAQITQHKNLENSSFTAASNMLDTMVNFNAKSAEVEKKANASLASVTQLKLISQNAGQSADALRLSLVRTQNAAMIANQTAAQANFLAQEKTQKLAPANTQALNLQAYSKSVLNDLNEKIANISKTNETAIAPADLQCSNIQSTVSSFQAKDTEALNKAAQASRDVDETKVNIQRLMSQINAIQLLSAAEIEKLRQDVVAAGTSFGQQNLEVAVQTMRKNLADQAAKLAIIKQKIAQLKLQRDQLKAVTSGLKP